MQSESEHPAPQELAVKPSNALPLASRPTPRSSPPRDGGDKPVGPGAAGGAAGSRGVAATAGAEAEFEEGESVMLQGLESAPHLNGRAATVASRPLPRSCSALL